MEVTGVNSAGVQYPENNPLVAAKPEEEWEWQKAMMLFRL